MTCSKGAAQAGGHVLLMTGTLPEDQRTAAIIAYCSIRVARLPAAPRRRNRDLRAANGDRFARYIRPIAASTTSVGATEFADQPRLCACVTGPARRRTIPGHRDRRVRARPARHARQASKAPAACRPGHQRAARCPSQQGVRHGPPEHESGPQSPLTSSSAPVPSVRCNMSGRYSTRLDVSSAATERTFRAAVPARPQARVHTVRDRDDTDLKWLDSLPAPCRNHRHLLTRKCRGCRGFSASI